MRRWPIALALILLAVAGPSAAGAAPARTPTPDAAPGRNLIAESGLGLMALSAGLGIAYRVWNAATPRNDKAPLAPPEELRAQVQAIAALDEDFANNVLEESDYRRQRAHLKQTLREALCDKE